MEMQKWNHQSNIDMFDFEYARNARRKDGGRLCSLAQKHVLQIQGVLIEPFENHGAEVQI